jgi:alpha-L-fucosidase
MPNGRIQPEFVQTLHEVGEWMRKNGESIYDTRGGPITPRPWGVTTQKSGKIYVHVLDWSDEVLALPKLANVRGASLLGSGQNVEVKQVDGATLLKLPAGRDAVDTVVVLAADERR